IRSLSAAGAVALGACAPGEEAPPGPASPRPEASPEATARRVTLRLPGEDSGFPSPFAYRRGPGYVQMSFLYDTLLWKDSTGELLPWLAQHWDRSDDGTVYTFDLREGVRWHDGRPLTPDDVVFTFDYYASQRVSPQVIVQPVPGIAQVNATGERTVEFHLEHPIVTFEQFGGVGAVPIVPRHIWEGIDNAAQATDPELLVGSGPYRLQSYSPGEGAYLYRANDDFFLGAPFVERIENIPVGDELTALLAGEVAAASGSGLRPDALAPFEAAANFEILTAPPGSSTLALYWNLARGGALADLRFRRACCHAIDREDMVRRLFGGNGTTGNPGWIPPEHPYHVDVEQYPFDLDRARRLLDEAGYAAGPDGVRQDRDGRPLRFTLLVAAPPPPAVDLVVGALRAIGVDLAPQALDTPTFNQRMIAGDSDMSMIGSGGMNSDLAPDYMRLVYASTTELTQHAQGYANARFDRLAEEQLRTLDEAERKDTVARMQEIVAGDVPLLPLFYPDSFSIHNRQVFDQWYYTTGGVAGVIPTTHNKQLFVTGLPTGLTIRPFEE
ncbi:MAG TPA: ABC transporter substrate-binding protein, partial [Egibacteraceae bacterium]|nr:ABC transporter substrate-binding protein [Egibacteraceae bacterium]